LTDLVVTLVGLLGRSCDGRSSAASPTASGSSCFAALVSVTLSI
jgi:hypothetical protein